MPLPGRYQAGQSYRLQIDAGLVDEFGQTLGKPVNASLRFADHHPRVDIGAVGRNFTVRADSPVIRAVFVSLSKPLGVYYHRVGGVFSRDALPGLYGNRWFKTSFGLALGIALCERFGVHEIPRRYAALQRQETMRIAHETGIALAPSDAVLLAHGPAAQPNMPDDIAALRRGHSVRLCLTPSLERAFPRA